MQSKVFIDNFIEAFAPGAQLPLAFWYSDSPLAHTDRIEGCFFKGLEAVRQGSPVSLSSDTIGCGGGKFYSGFVDMPPHVPSFVSLKEKYKKSPEMALEFINDLGVERASKPYLNFARIDAVDDLDHVEGLLFFATPDILTGLASWAFFDNNSDDAVTSMFGSGCSTVVTQAVNENRLGGRRTFLGLLDPSVRPFVDENVLSFVIPRSRLREMFHTMRESSLFDTHAWAKVRQRINSHTQYPS